MWEPQGLSWPRFRVQEIFPKYEGRLERRGVLIDPWKNGAGGNGGHHPISEERTYQDVGANSGSYPC